MWKNVGNDKILQNKVVSAAASADSKGKQLYHEGTLAAASEKKRVGPGYWRVDCQSASKGLFLGLLCLVGGIIILIIFFVMKVNQADSKIKLNNVLVRAT